jgi:hypothetical protein
MARVDLVALQQRMAQQQPKPATSVPAEPVGHAVRDDDHARGAALESDQHSAERAEEPVTGKALRAQIDKLNAALAVANAEAERVGGGNGSGWAG